jgi:plasmid stabilization system protein ParE
MSDIVSKVRYSHSAIRDLEQIGDYIAKELKSPPSALRTVSKTQDSIGKLANYPKSRICIFIGGS